MPMTQSGTEIEGNALETSANAFQGNEKLRSNEQTQQKTAAAREQRSSRSTALRAGPPLNGRQSVSLRLHRHRIRLHRRIGLG